MDVLFDEIALDEVTTSMTISGPAVPVFCMYLVAAERQGADTSKLNGTLQTDIFKEYIAQKEWLFGPEPHLKLIGDLMEYCGENIPAYKPLSVSGYHIREAGSTAAQELAFTLADGFGYIELGLSRGLDIDTFAPGLSFFFDSHLDFFEEIAKFRAGRRIWARWVRDVYGAKTEKAQWMRFHTQTAGVSLTAQQPYNNVVRTGIEALAAVLGGTNSLHTNALDETLALPSEQAAEIALRTQQVIMEETGVVNVADPLGGSLVRRGAHRQARGRGQRDLRQDPRDGRLRPAPRPDRGAGRVRARRRGPGHAGTAPRHRGRLVHVRDRRGGLRLPDRAREGREEGRRRELPQGLGDQRAGDPARLARGGDRAGADPRRAPGRPRRGGHRTRHRGDAQRRPRGPQHDPVDAGRLPGRGDARARSATPCVRSGASTGSRRASDAGRVVGWRASWRQADRP